MEIFENLPRVENLPDLELHEYQALVRPLPRPSDQQIREFAAHVSEAKSWYKHLPLCPPGEPFHFFVDPCAGLDRVVQAGGKATYLRRTESTPQFHYAWITTEDYRSRYGHLAFACEAGTRILLPMSVELHDAGRTRIVGLLDNNPCRLSVHLTNQLEFRLPQEVMDDGVARLTAVVHRLAARPWVWSRFLRPGSPSLDWPEETGGSETGARIVERCRTISELGVESSSVDEVDGRLAILLAPERSRLLDQMIAAMKRMRDRVYG